MKVGLPSGETTNKIIRGVAIAGGIFVVYKVLDYYVFSKEENITKQDVKKDIDLLKKQGITLSYPLSQYEIWSSQILQAVNTIMFMQDEEAIMRILGYMKNDADILQLVKAFGKRQLEGGLFMNKGDGTLPELIQFALDNDEIKVVNLGFQRKGITYRF